MNKVLLVFLILTIASFGYAQNKSLGVGTATPNPNAALHVESPTGNQGAIMPRLSTAQRTAMSAILGAPDAGLLLYDNDEKALYIWNGSTWESSAKIRYPQVDTITSLPANGNALRIVYNSTDVGNFGVAHFENLNPNSGFSAIFGRTNSATNGAADFSVNNPANTNDAIGVTSNALNGRAGAFTLNNAGSLNHALYAQSNGDSTGSAVHGNNIGNGFGVFGKSAGSKFASAAVYGEHVGTGDAAGAFRINNPANTYSALYGETNGSGSALFANNLGTGRAGQIQINNPANSSAALRAFTNGTGNAGFFTINNVANDSSALYITTNGTGNAITANAPIQATQFIGDGSLLTNVGGGLVLPLTDTLTNADMATDFDALNITYTGDSARTLLHLNFANAANTQVANPFRITHAGQGASFVVTQSGPLGTGGIVQLTNPASASQAFRATTAGTGQAGNFRITNASSTAVSLYTETNGSGPALHARNIGTANGFAGLFRNDSTSNTFPAIQASTRGSGTGVRVIQDVNSIGGGIDVYMNNTSSTAPGFQVNHQGLGNAGVFNVFSPGNNVPSLDAYTNGLGAAGNFNIDNLSNSANSVNATTSGSGSAVAAVNNGTGFGIYARALGNTDAIYAVKESTDGTGSAGNFINQNLSNGASTLFAMTNAEPGSAIGAINSGNGNALAIFQGGIKVSTSTLNASTNTVISTRATAYFIEDASLPFTFSGGVAFNEGDMIYIFNGDSVNNATIDGFTLATDQGIAAIYMAGALRFFAYMAP